MGMGGTAGGQAGWPGGQAGWPGWLGGAALGHKPAPGGNKGGIGSQLTGRAFAYDELPYSLVYPSPTKAGFEKSGLGVGAPHVPPPMGEGVGCTGVGGTSTGHVRATRLLDRHTTSLVSGTAWEARRSCGVSRGLCHSSNTSLNVLL